MVLVVEARHVELAVFCKQRLNAVNVFNCRGVDMPPHTVIVPSDFARHALSPRLEMLGETILRGKNSFDLGLDRIAIRTIKRSQLRVTRITAFVVRPGVRFVRSLLGLDIATKLGGVDQLFNGKQPQLELLDQIRGEASVYLGHPEEFVGLNGRFRPLPGPVSEPLKATPLLVDLYRYLLESAGIAAEDTRVTINVGLPASSQFVT